MLPDKNELKFDIYLYAKKIKEANKWDDVKLEHLAGRFDIEVPGHIELTMIPGSM